MFCNAQRILHEDRHTGVDTVIKTYRLYLERYRNRLKGRSLA